MNKNMFYHKYCNSIKYAYILFIVSCLSIRLIVLLLLNVYYCHSTAKLFLFLLFINDFHVLFNIGQINIKFKRAILLW
jgi:hypothetical protein